MTSVPASLKRVQVLPPVFFSEKNYSKNQKRHLRLLVWERLLRQIPLHGAGMGLRLPGLGRCSASSRQVRRRGCSGCGGASIILGRYLIRRRKLVDVVDRPAPTAPAGAATWPTTRPSTRHLFPVGNRLAKVKLINVAMACDCIKIQKGFRGYN